MRRRGLAWCPSSCRTWSWTSASRLTSLSLITWMPLSCWKSGGMASCPQIMKTGGGALDGDARAVFRPFPGLAPAEDQQLSQAQRQQALSALPPAHIGLVAARQSADVLALIGYH